MSNLFIKHVFPLMLLTLATPVVMAETPQAESVDYLQEMSRLERQISITKKYNELELIRKQGGESLSLPRVVSISEYGGVRKATVRNGQGVQRTVKAGDTLNEVIRISRITPSSVTVQVGNKHLDLDFEPAQATGEGQGTTLLPVLPVLRADLPPVPPSASSSIAVTPAEAGQVSLPGQP